MNSLIWIHTFCKFTCVFFAYLVLTGLTPLYYFFSQTIVGTDLADLLLEGHEPTTLDYRQTGMKIAQSLEMLDADEDGEMEQSVVMADRSSVNRTKTVEEITDRFRHLLLYGRKKVGLRRLETVRRIICVLLWFARQSQQRPYSIPLAGGGPIGITLSICQSVHHVSSITQNTYEIFMLPTLKN